MLMEDCTPWVLLVFNVIWHEKEAISCYAFSQLSGVISSAISITIIEINNW